MTKDYNFGIKSCNPSKTLMAVKAQAVAFRIMEKGKVAAAFHFNFSLGMNDPAVLFHHPLHGPVKIILTVKVNDRPVL